MIPAGWVPIPTWTSVVVIKVVLAVSVVLSWRFAEQEDDPPDEPCDRVPDGVGVPGSRRERSP